MSYTLVVSNNTGDDVYEYSCRTYGYDDQFLFMTDVTRYNDNESYKADRVMVAIRNIDTIAATQYKE